MAITQSITPFTNIPSIADPTNFAAEGEDFLGTQLPRLATEVQAFATQANALAASMNAVASGGAFAGAFTFATSTSGNPGTGAAALNNATQASATILRLNLTDAASGTQTANLDALDDSTSTVKGRFRLTNVSTGGWIAGDLTAVTTQTGYRDLTLTNVTVSAADPLTAGAACVFAFSPKGDKGDTGAPGTLSGTAVGAINWNTAQTIASATTTDIGAATSNYVLVSGAVTITGLGTIAQGAERVVRFTGAPLLTYHATNLVLPGAANIQVAAGDIGRFVSEGGGAWRCTEWTPISALPLVTASQAEATAGTENTKPMTALRVSQAIAALAGSGITRVARSSNTILAAADKGTLVEFSSTFTQTFTAAATLGAGWSVFLANMGTGDITLDPNASETIDGLTSFVMYPGEVRLVMCDGSTFESVVLKAFEKTFTSSGTFTKPPGYARFGFDATGGGGGGGSGGTYAASNDRNGGGGGGGGARVIGSTPASAVGSTATATVGAGGAAGTAFSDGGVGGTTSLVGVCDAYGGAGGTFDSGGYAYGGGGAGVKSAGGGFTGGDPAIPYSTTTVQHFGGGNGSFTSDLAGNTPSPSVFGGGGGGGCYVVTTTIHAGTYSIYGGGGGGAGGYRLSGGSTSSGSVGGKSGFASDGTTGGSAGAAGGRRCGGGGGNVDQNGGAGGAAGGGGGGGGATNSTMRDGGAGGAGELSIWGIV